MIERLKTIETYTVESMVAKTIRKKRQDNKQTVNYSILKKIDKSTYSGDLNSELVRYSNGPKQFAR